MSAAQTSTNNGSNDAPVVSGPIHHIHLGYIGRWDEERGDYEPTDEALIFLNDDNEQTCHVEGPNAKAMAAFIVRAVNSHEALVKALETFVEEYTDLVNSGDAGFWDPEKEPKVIAARAALTSAREVQP